MVVHYEYCFKATTDPSTGETQPCNETYFADGGAALMNQVDYNDPWYVMAFCASDSPHAPPLRQARKEGQP
jgi:hypothetical protein